MRFLAKATTAFLFLYSTAFGTPRFDPETLHELAKESIVYRNDNSDSLKAQLDFIHNELMTQYPGIINENPKWVFNHNAAALGQLQILYCSASEYLIFFGTNIGTESHSWRHHMDVWDMMLIGEMWTSLEGELERHTLKEGDVAFLPRGQVKHYALPQSAYMLEYGRGNVIKGLYDGVIAPALFINQDWLAMRNQLQECGKIYVRQLFRK